VNALQRFEDWVSATLEDRLGTLLGARIEPADLARRLADAMDDQKAVGARRILVPNVYRVYLSPWAFAGFAGYQTALQEELATFVGRRAAELELQMIGRARVELLVDPGARPERVRVEAHIAEAAGALDQHTRTLDLGPVAAPVQHEMLLEVPGRGEVRMAGELLTVGRALDNDVILDEPSVSRHHATLVRRGGYWLLEDQRSTHGSYVNGHRVTSGLLRPGDEIRLGSAVLRLRHGAPQ
jgi:hypothetical protein